MQQQFKWLLAAVVLLGMMGANMPASLRADEDQDPTKEISGKLVSVILQESSVKIQYLEDEKSQTYRTSVFYVDQDSDIIRDEDICELSDLKPGENVFIEYVHDANGKDMIVTLSLDEQQSDSGSDPDSQ